MRVLDFPDSSGDHIIKQPPLVETVSSTCPQTSQYHRLNADDGGNSFRAPVQALEVFIRNSVHKFIAIVSYEEKMQTKQPAL